MNRKITPAQAEAFLAKCYVNRMASFTYPGYDTIYGKVDEISIDLTGTEPMVIIQMNGKRYTCSPDSLKDCLKLLTNEKRN